MSSLVRVSSLSKTRLPVRAPVCHGGIVHACTKAVNQKMGGVPITCDGCKSTLVFSTFSRGFTRYRDTTDFHRSFTNGEGLPHGLVAEALGDQAHQLQLPRRQEARHGTPAILVAQ